MQLGILQNLRSSNHLSHAFRTCTTHVTLASVLSSCGRVPNLEKTVSHSPGSRSTYSCIFWLLPPLLTLLNPVITVLQTDWEVVERGWHAHVLGDSPHNYTTASEALKDLRAKDPKVNDQYYPPWVVVDDAGKAVGPIEDGDSVVIWNFRADRVVSLVLLLCLIVSWKPVSGAQRPTGLLGQA